MARKLPAPFMAYRNPKLLHIEAKTLDLDRVLNAFFMRLDNNGGSVTIRRGQTVSREGLLNNVRAEISEGLLNGFTDDTDTTDVTWQWLKSDLLDIINQKQRVVPDADLRIAAPHPLHLSSYKLRNPKYARDYNASDQLYSMVSDDPALLEALCQYLGSSTTAGSDALDISSLMIMLLAEPEEARSIPTALEKPVLPQQAAMLRDDLWRLLAYRAALPRQTIVEMLRTVLGIHLGFYVLHLADALPRWLANGTISDEGSLKLLVDLSEDAKSAMAVMARASFNHYVASLTDYVRGVLAFNQLQRLAEKRLKIVNPTAAQIVETLQERNGEMFHYYFDARVDELLESTKSDQGDIDAEMLAASNSELDDFDKLIEMISTARLSFNHRYAVELVSTTLLKNTPYGLLRSSMGRWEHAKPRFCIAPRLLETFVLLALLEGGPGSYHTRPLTIDEFVDWLAYRYGIYISPLEAGIVSGDAYPAYRANMDALRARLRDIGFYTDLSDASTAQTLTPRYHV